MTKSIIAGLAVAILVFLVTALILMPAFSGQTPGDMLLFTFPLTSGLIVACTGMILHKLGELSEKIARRQAYRHPQMPPAAGDTLPCPGCGRTVAADARSCPFCGFDRGPEN